MRMPRLIPALFTVVLLPSIGAADSIAVSYISLDWSGMTFTTTGLSISRIDYAISIATSSARTAEGSFVDLKNSSTYPLNWSFTSAASNHVSPQGYEAATASTANGLMLVNAQAYAAGPAPSAFTSRSSAATDRAFWLYGSGTGSLTVSIPYVLTVECTADPNGTSDARASASLSLGPGVGWFTSDTLTCIGPSTKSGTLTLTKDFTNPTFGPLTTIFAQGNTTAAATIPESPSLTLTGIPLLIIALAVTRR